VHTHTKTALIWKRWGDCSRSAPSLLQGWALDISVVQKSHAVCSQSADVCCG